MNNLNKAINFNEFGLIDGIACKIVNITNSPAVIRINYEKISYYIELQKENPKIYSLVQTPGEESQVVEIIGSKKREIRTKFEEIKQNAY